MSSSSSGNFSISSTISSRNLTAEATSLTTLIEPQTSTSLSVATSTFIPAQAAIPIIRPSRPLITAFSTFISSSSSLSSSTSETENSETSTVSIGTASSSASPSQGSEFLPPASQSAPQSNTDVLLLIIIGLLALLCIGVFGLLWQRLRSKKEPSAKDELPSSPPPPNVPNPRGLLDNEPFFARNNFPPTLPPIATLREVPPSNSSFQSFQDPIDQSSVKESSSASFYTSPTTPKPSNFNFTGLGSSFRGNAEDSIERKPFVFPAPIETANLVSPSSVLSQDHTKINDPNAQSTKISTWIDSFRIESPVIPLMTLSRRNLHSPNAPEGALFQFEDGDTVSGSERRSYCSTKTVKEDDEPGFLTSPTSLKRFSFGQDNLHVFNMTRESPDFLFETEDGKGKGRADSLKDPKKFQRPVSAAHSFDDLLAAFNDTHDESDMPQRKSDKSGSVKIAEEKPSLDSFYSALDDPDNAISKDSLQSLQTCLDLEAKESKDSFHTAQSKLQKTSQNSFYTARSQLQSDPRFSLASAASNYQSLEPSEADIDDLEGEPDKVAQTISTVSFKTIKNDQVYDENNVAILQGLVTKIVNNPLDL